MRTIVLLSLLLATSAHAQDPAAVDPDSISTTTTYYALRDAQEALGKQWREDYNAAKDAMDAQRTDEAARTFAKILAACEGYARPGLRVIAAHDADEYVRAAARTADGTPTEWLDMVCPRAATDSAYLAVEAKDFDGALARIRQASEWAPLWADPHNEHGFVLGQLQRREEALVQYREAIDLATASGDKPVLAMAWRGVGFQSSELGRWNDARAAYRRSLEVEPGNQLAKDELAWIDRQDPAGASN
ncbi:Diguanylate cyclase/phosphodiesterase [Lysobacter dokdonensis DS-58]|uniref:Diguanylate cyclase/phosphodiesterase n=1 Tax=Lysobacter dokdonensis DS-58 TaxID=1300345 RepID=A0A0A2WGE0_9GAMM|nr:hypothetical protein [Lysobacter dokdonensis]KGQ17772.1 Diguanylate cyclase/phosphodiesterase [Lysobacter dokdonensis DS-58]